MMLRGVRSPTRTRVQDLGAHIADLEQGGHRAVFLTANLPAAVLIGQLEALDVETDRVLFIDAISNQDIAHEASPRHNVMLLSGPCALEFMAQRIRKIVRFIEHEHPGEGHPHVVIGSMNALALYNDRGMLEQFLHRLRNQWGHRPVVVDILVDDGPGSDPGIQALVERYAEAMVDLGSPAAPAPPSQTAAAPVQASHR